MINGLTEDQLIGLPQGEGDRIGRFMCDGRSISITSGAYFGGNIINQLFYWDRSKSWFVYVRDCLLENNPGKVIRIDYSS